MPVGTSHGNVTAIGGHCSRCMVSRAAVVSGRGTSRSLPPFGGAKTSRAPTYLIWKRTCTIRDARSRSSTAGPNVSPCRRPSPPVRRPGPDPTLLFGRWLDGLAAPQRVSPSGFQGLGDRDVLARSRHRFTVRARAGIERKRASVEHAHRLQQPEHRSDVCGPGLGQLPVMAPFTHDQDRSTDVRGPDLAAELCRPASVAARPFRTGPARRVGAVICSGAARGVAR